MTSAICDYFEYCEYQLRNMMTRLRKDYLTLYTRIEKIIKINDVLLGNCWFIIEDNNIDWNHSFFFISIQKKLGMFRYLVESGFTRNVGLGKIFGIITTKAKHNWAISTNEFTFTNILNHLETLMILVLCPISIVWYSSPRFIWSCWN